MPVERESGAAQGGNASCAMQPRRSAVARTHSQQCRFVRQNRLSRCRGWRIGFSITGRSASRWRKQLESPRDVRCHITLSERFDKWFAKHWERGRLACVTRLRPQSAISSNSEPAHRFSAGRQKQRARPRAPQTRQSHSLGRHVCALPRTTHRNCRGQSAGSASGSKCRS